jgi:diacylglycerol kinase family enzyme
MTGSLSLLKWMGLVRLRLQERVRGLIGARGREIAIEGASPLVFQFDGEAGPPTNGAHDPRLLRITVEAAALPVLVP